MTPPNLMKQPVPVWTITLMFTILLSLVGVVYSNVQRDIDAKANKEAVQIQILNLKEDLDEIKATVNRIEEMHRRHGYK